MLKTFSVVTDALVLIRSQAAPWASRRLRNALVDVAPISRPS
jgi:hypothetical protein